MVQSYAREASTLMLDCLKNPSVASRNLTEDVPGAIEDVAELPAAEIPLPKAANVLVEAPFVETVFDISQGAREFLSVEAVSELLKPLTVPGNSYSSICLSNRSFGRDAAEVAGKVLEALKDQLVQVNLADIVAGRPEEEALAVMSIFASALEGCNLKSLDVSDNALGEKGVRAFSALFKSQHNLQELYFKNNGISEEAAVAICELLPSTEKMRILHFHNNMSGDAGAVALSGIVRKAPLLENFRFSSTRVATEGGIALSEALLSGTRLERIDLRDNPFGEDGGIALAKPLRQHIDLKEVYLSYLGFEDNGAEAVLEALQAGAPGLQILDLAGNEMTVRSAKNLADCVASKGHLTILNLSENELQDEGVILVCKALHNGHEDLVELDLSETDMGRVGACAAAQAVAQKPKFGLLSMNGNHISRAGVEAVKDLLQKCAHVIGSLDDNQEEEGSEEDEEQEEGVEEADLQTQLSNMTI